jgi:hypothetical protein
MVVRSRGVAQALIRKDSESIIAKDGVVLDDRFGTAITGQDDGDGEQQGLG